MGFMLGLVLGILVGGVGAVLYYRKHTAQVEAALKEAREDLWRVKVNK